MPTKFIVYKITNLINNKFYIGAHATINVNDSYMGSGKLIYLAIKKYGLSNFKKDILYVLKSKKEMYNKERFIVNRKFINRKDTYNLKIGGTGGFSSFNKVTVKDVNGKIFQIDNKDSRYLSGELISINKNTLLAINNGRLNFRVSNKDPRYLSGELISIAKGLILVKDLKGKSHQVSIKDPRYLTGELIPIAKDKITVIDINGKTSQVCKNDPRYLTGELVSTCTGIKNSKQTRLKISKSISNKKWMYNLSLEKCKRIDREDIPKMLNYNWILGRRSFTK